MDISSSKTIIHSHGSLRESGDVVPGLNSPGYPQGNQLHARIISFLSSNQTHGLSGPVDVIEKDDHTLFFAEPYCYKLLKQKLFKPGATLEEKQRRIEMELLRGKSFAPDFYLGLAPVWLYGASLSLEWPKSCALDEEKAGAPVPSGSIVDWLIVLRYNAADRNYGEMVEIYQPNFSECRHLANLVTPLASSPDMIEEDPRIWFSFLQKQIKKHEPLVRGLDRNSKSNTLRACLNRAEDLIVRLDTRPGSRLQFGHMRSIHGNVRLASIVQSGSSLALLDPMICECSREDFRYNGHPLFDLASLVGDLWSRNLKRQANWVFSHYCNALLRISDMEDLQAMDLYLFVQALQQAGQYHAELCRKYPVDTLKKTSSVNETIKECIRTARDSLLQDEAKLIVVSGASQSDRSHLARLLAPCVGRMPGALYLSAEEEMLALCQVKQRNDLPASAHAPDVWSHVYTRMREKAQLALEAGYSVILEGRFEVPEHRQHISELNEIMGDPHTLVAFYLSKERHRSAMSQGQNSSDLELLAHKGLSDPTHGVLRKECRFNDWTDWVDLDSSRSVGEMISRALCHINVAPQEEECNTIH